MFDKLFHYDLDEYNIKGVHVEYYNVKGVQVKIDPKQNVLSVWSMWDIIIYFTGIIKYIPKKQIKIGRQYDYSEFDEVYKKGSDVLIIRILDELLTSPDYIAKIIKIFFIESVYSAEIIIGGM